VCVCVCVRERERDGRRTCASYIARPSGSVACSFKTKIPATFIDKNAIKSRYFKPLYLSTDSLPCSEEGCGHEQPLPETEPVVWG
jgi:hypothetical protein